MLTKASSSSTNPRTAHRDGGALKRRKPQAGDKAAPKARRRPVFTLTLKQVLQRCRDCGREMICAGEVLVVMELMRLAGWSIAELAERSTVSESHLSDFLNVRKFLTTHSARRIARAFRLPLSCLDTLAERWVGDEDSP